MSIDRSFVRLTHGLVHYRSSGPEEPTRGLPVVMFHQSPGSSRVLQQLVAQVGASREVIAPDTAGNGDSEPLELGREHEIAEFADVHLEMLDALGVERFIAFGSHTGANISVDLATRYPDRVAGLVLDGMGFYSDELRTEMLAEYTPAVEITLDGGHAWWAWHFVRDTYVFFPWYRRDAGSRTTSGLPEDPRELHAKFVEVLKALETYGYSYRAAFRFPKAERLARVSQPVLYTVGALDVLNHFADEVVAQIQDVRKVTIKAGSHHEYMETVGAELMAFAASIDEGDSRGGAA